MLAILLVLGIVTILSAQDRWEGRRQGVRPETETLTVSGTLTVVHGMPAITSGDFTYVVGRLRGLVGFVDGLKEGAQVTIAGTAISRPEDTLRYLWPSNLTLDGKSYDMTLPEEFCPFGGPMGGWRNAPPGSMRYHHRNPGYHRRQAPLGRNL